MYTTTLSKRATQLLSAALTLTLAAACTPGSTDGTDPVGDAGPLMDAGPTMDVGSGTDAGTSSPQDAGAGGSRDAGQGERPDAGPPDAGPDTDPPDAGPMLPTDGLPTPGSAAWPFADDVGSALGTPGVWRCETADASSYLVEFDGSSVLSVLDQNTGALHMGTGTVSGAQATWDVPGLSYTDSTTAVWAALDVPLALHMQSGLRCYMIGHGASGPEVPAGRVSCPNIHHVQGVKYEWNELEFGPGHSVEWLHAEELLMGQTDTLTTTMHGVYKKSGDVVYMAFGRLDGSTEVLVGRQTGPTALYVRGWEPARGACEP